MEAGNFLWKSRMFCFQAKEFLEELEKFAPEVFKKSKCLWEQNQKGKLNLEASMEIPSISVDYAVMENSDKIKVVPSSFEWSDMGSFEAVYNYFKEHGHPMDENGNMLIGCEKHTSFVGLKNCILVCTEDANLVLQKESSQDVKRIYQQLEQQKSVLLN